MHGNIFKSREAGYVAYPLIINCFSVMVTKQKCLFVFFCCLFFTTIIVPHVEGQSDECVRTCQRRAEIQRRRCRLIRDPVRRLLCLLRVDQQLTRCIIDCTRAIFTTNNPTTTSNPAAAGNPYN